MVWLFSFNTEMKKEAGLIGKAILHTYQNAGVNRFLNELGIFQIIFLEVNPSAEGSHWTL